MSGADFSDTLKGETLLLTNHHVVYRGTDGIKPRRARAQFESVGNAEVELTEVVWTSPTHVLDASLVRFEGNLPGFVEPIKELGALPDVGDLEQDRAYIIGHPHGRPAAMSIHDNVILDMDDRAIHYRSPTERGNSGSPVFDTDWGLIGLHRSGNEEMAKLNGEEGFYEANEGIRIDVILTAARAELG